MMRLGSLVRTQRRVFKNVYQNVQKLYFSQQVDSKQLDEHGEVSHVELGLDVTGNFFTTSNRKGRTRGDDLDDGIMACITGEKDGTSSMRSIIQSDNKCALAHLLLLFEHFRHRNPTNSFEEMRESLETLENMACAGHLTKRELYLGTALDAWISADFYRAGRALEHYIMFSDCKHDALVLKLAQESYIQAGDSRNALHCVSRSGMTLHKDHMLHGDVMGMLAMGLSECGLLDEAEVAGQDAVKITRGRNSFAIGALVQTLLLKGRGSEVYGLVHELENKHAIGLSRVYVLFSGACGKFLRGEYGASAGYIRQMLECMETDGAVSRDGVALAGYALWLLELSYENQKDRDSLAVKLALLAGSLSPAPNDVITNAALASLAAPAQRRFDHLTEDDNGESLTGEQKLINRVAPIMKAHSWDLTETTSSEECKQIYDAHLDLLRSMATGLGGLVDCMPTFRANYQPRPVDLNRNSSTSTSTSTSTSSSGLNSSAQEESLPSIELSHALSLFSSGDYSECADILRDMQGSLPFLGGTAWCRYIIHATRVEAMLRSGRESDIREARLLLSDRTAAAPSDGQTWWRLAAVSDYVINNEKRSGGQKGCALAVELTSDMHRQAHQLGIGQGGFKKYSPYPLPMVE